MHTIILLVVLFLGIIFFNLKKVKDKATYSSGFERVSCLDHVIVKGKILIENGELKAETFLGKDLKSKVKL